MISERLQRLKYIASDLVTSNIAWLAYSCLRYQMNAVQGSYHSLVEFLTSRMVVAGQLLFPLMMMAVYYLSGYYNQVYRKSRVQELFTTLWSSVITSLIIFFVALINDVGAKRSFDYEMILLLVALTFVCVYTARCIITTHTSRLIKSRKWSFPTLVVGRGDAAIAFGKKLDEMKYSLGYKIMGYVGIPGESDSPDAPMVSYTLETIGEACREMDIQELIVVPSEADTVAVMGVINRLFTLNLPIKLSPDRTRMLMSQVRLSNMVGAPLIDVSSSSMGECSKNIKRLIDVVASAVTLVLLSPVYLIISVMVKCDSRGPVFYRQERVGYHNRPFNIIKFRTMVNDAERNGQPQLSSGNDPRITRLGHYLRKYRIDELPQFWNVLRGDMSIVGPRPERQYYIDQIIERIPSYALLRQVRPGITSLGMVKFGYAQNVDEMVERLSYDLLYLENMSLLNDFKIMVYTVKIVLTGRGI